MDEVEVDAQAVQGGEARFAIGQDCPGAAVRNPATPGPCHAALRDDSHPRVRTAFAQRAGEEALVVPRGGFVHAIRVRGVEDRYPGIGSGGDGRDSGCIVRPSGRRKTHAAEADSELRGVEPSRAVQASEGTAQSGVL